MHAWRMDGLLPYTHGKVGMSVEIQSVNENRITMKFALHVITKHKQQLGKLLFVFAASRLYDYHATPRNRCPTSSHHKQNAAYM